MKKATKLCLGIIFCLCVMLFKTTLVFADEKEIEGSSDPLLLEVNSGNNDNYLAPSAINGTLASGEIRGVKTATISNDNNREAVVTITINGKEFSQKETSYESMDIALVIDVSGSMDKSTTVYQKDASGNILYDEFGNPKTESVTRLEAAKRSALSLAKTLLDKNTATTTYFRVSLSTFDSSAIVIQSLTSSYSVIETAINNMATGSRTNVQAGINKGATTLYESNNDKIVILLTDGEANKSEGTLSGNTYTYTDTSHQISYTYVNNDRHYNAAKAAGYFFRTDESYKITFYTIGFGTNVTANSLLVNIADSSSRFYSANDGEELAKAFQKIVETLVPRTDLATDAVLTDIIPNDFILTEAEKASLKTLYGDDISFVETENGTKITLNIGNISSKDPITLSYKVIAKDEYHGSMYTNYEATLNAKPSTGNPYSYTLNNDGQFILTLEKPSVVVPAITKDDNLGTVNSNENKTINKNDLLNNDSNSYFINGTEIENAVSLLDTIEIVSMPGNGTLTLNSDKTAFIYTPTAFDKTSDSFTYKIITKVLVGYDENNDPIYETVVSNVSTATITIVIVKGNVIVKYVEKGNHENVLSSNTLTEQIGKSYETEDIDIQNWIFTNLIPSNANGVFTKEDIIVIYEYEKVMGTLTIKYVDLDGNEILPSDNYEEQIGTEYVTEAKESDDYFLNKVIGDEKGNYIDGNIEVTYVYEPYGQGGEIEPPKTGLNENVLPELLMGSLFTILLVFPKKKIED